MADDIAKLGFSVETKELVKAQKELDKVAKSGESVEKSGGLISRSMTSAASDTKKSGGLISQSMNSAASSTATSGGLISSSMNSATKSVSGLSSAFNGLTGLIASIGLASLATDAFNTYRSFESMNASLKTVTGSAEAASAAFKEISEFAKTTPYTLDQSVEGFQKLKALGLDPSMEALRSYGNTASAMGKDLTQMIEAVADASTGEFERLKEFGIKSSSEGDKVSFTFQGITKTIGKNSAEIQAYLRAIGDTQFSSAMSDQMKTINGKLANLSDSWMSLQVSLMQNGGAQAATLAIETLSSVVVSITENTKEWALAVGLLAAALLRNKIAAIIASIAQSKIYIQTLIASTLATTTQTKAVGLMGATTVTTTARVGAATVAMGALRTVIAFMGGPLGLFALAAGSVLIYREEIMQAITHTGRLQAATEKSNAVVEDAKNRAYEYANASESVRQALVKQTNAEIESAKAKLKSNEAAVKLARGNLERAIELDKIGESDPMHVSLTDTRMRELRSELKILEEQERAIEASKKSLDSFGKSVSELNVIYGASSAATAKNTEALNNTSGAAGSAAGKVKELVSQFEREKQALTQAVIAKTQGKEAAYRYQLSLEKLTKPQIELLVNLKRQSGAFDEVKKKTAAVISEYDRELQALTKSNTEKERGTLAAYEYAISLKNITPEEQKFLVSLKKKELSLIAAKEASEKTTAETKRNAEEAQRAAKSIKDAYDREVEALTKNNTAKEQGELAAYEYAVSLMKLKDEEEKHLISLKKKAIALDDLEEKQKAFNDLVKQAKQSLEKAETPLQSYVRVTAEYADMLSKSAIKQDEYNKLVANAYDIYKKNDPVIKAATEAEKKRTDAIEDAEKALKDSEAAEELARKSIGMSEVAYRSAALQLKNGYNKQIADSQAKSEAAAKVYTSIKSLIEEMKDPSQQLAEETEKLNEMWETGELDALTYSKALEQITEKYDEVAIEAKKAAEEIKSMSADMSKSFASSMLDGDFAGIGEKLTSTFKNDILNPILDDAINPFATAVTKAMSGVGDSISGIISGTGSTGGLFSSIGSGIRSIAASGSSSIFSGAGLGSGIASLVGGDSLGGAVGGAIGSALTPVFGVFSSAVGGLLGSLAGSIFGGQKTVKATGSALQYGDGEFEGSTFVDMRKEGGWFSSSKKWTEYTALEEEAATAISDYFDTVESSIKSQAEFFGVTSAQSIIGSFDSGLIKIDGDGDMSDQIENWANGITDELYEAVFKAKFDSFAQTGEDLATTISRLIIEIDTVKQGFDGLGLSFEYTGIKAAEVADGLTQAAGSLDNLMSIMESYYDVVYSDTEKTLMLYVKASDAIAEFNANLGLSGDAAIDTAEELRAYVDSLDVTTEAGQEAMVMAFALAESISTFSGTAQEAAEALEDTADEVQSLGDKISDMVVALYGSATDAYNEELSRYTSLKSAAESIGDTIAGFSDGVVDNAASLYDSQADYNQLLKQAQSGDTSAIDELQAAAIRLKEAMTESYAGGSQSAQGVTQIESELKALQSSLLAQAGSEPIAPEEVAQATLTSEDRAILAGSLLDALNESSLVTGADILTLMNENGVYMNALAADFGLDIMGLRQANSTIAINELNRLTTLGDKVGQSGVYIAEQLGANLTTYATSVADALRQADEITTEVLNGLDPYLTAIENATTWEDLETNFTTLGGYINTLPADIKSKLNSQLNGLIGSTDAQKAAINGLSSLTVSELAKVASSFGSDITGLRSMSATAAANELKKLQQIATATGTTPAKVAAALGTSITEIKSQIVSELIGLTGIPESIKTELAPYIEQIQAATNVGDIDKTLADMNTYIDSLPEDIKDQINDQLNGINTSSGESVKALDALANLTTEGYEALAEDFGLNIIGLRKANATIAVNELNKLTKVGHLIGQSGIYVAKELGLNLEAYSSSIAEEMRSVNVPAEIATELEPYLTAIENANSWDDLILKSDELNNYIDTLPDDIKTKLSSYFSTLTGESTLIKKAVNSQTDDLASRIKILSDDIGIDVMNLRKANSTIAMNELNKLNKVGQQIGQSGIYVAKELGANLGTYSKSIAEEMRSVNVPAEIATELEPYLTAIENANSWDDLIVKSENLNKYIDTLPEDIRTQLGGHFADLVGESTLIKKSVNTQTTELIGRIKTLANDIGVDVMGLRKANATIAVNELNKLTKVGQLVGQSGIYVAKELGTNLASYSSSIAESMRSVDVSADVLSGMEPYLDAIENSTDWDDLITKSESLNKYIDTLPEDIRTQLGGHFASLVGESTLIKKAVNTQTTELTSRIKTLANDFGVDIMGLRQANATIALNDLSKLTDIGNKVGQSGIYVAKELGANLTTYSKSIAESMRELDVSADVLSGMEPYLKAIENSTDWDDLITKSENLNKYIATLPKDIRTQLGGHLGNITGNTKATYTATTNQTNTVVANLTKLANSIGIDVMGLRAANANIAKNDLIKIGQLSAAVNQSPAKTAAHLGITIKNFGTSIANSVAAKALTLGEEVLNGINPYLEAVRKATSAADLDSTLSNMSKYINTLPQDIRTQLGGHLGNITQATKATQNATTNTVKAVDVSNNKLKNSNLNLAWLSQINKKMGDLWWKMNQVAQFLNSGFNLKAPDSAFGTKATLGSYDIGSDYINGDQVAQIHNGEAIFTAAQSKGLRDSVNKILAKQANAPDAPQTVVINQNKQEDNKSGKLMESIVAELKATRAELKEMKDNQKSAAFALAKNTKDTFKVLDKWDIIGQPPERVS